MKPNGSQSTSKTDWARIDAISDAEIDTSDSPPLGEEFYSRAELRRREPVAVTIPIDPQILEWFRRQGGEWERRMSAALRIYAEAHRTAGR